MAKKSRTSWGDKGGPQWPKAEQITLNRDFPKHNPVVTATRLFMYKQPLDATPAVTFVKVDGQWVYGSRVFPSAHKAAQFAADNLL